MSMTQSGSAAQAQDQVQGAFLLDVVVCEGPAVLELLPGEDEALLVGRDALLVLDFGFDLVDGVGGVDFERYGLAREGLYEYLHSKRTRILNTRRCVSQ